MDAITVDNTLLPTYDNSRPDNHSTNLALTNNEGFNYGIITGLNAFYADYVAFIGENNIKPNKNIKDEIKYLPETGNIIVRNKTDNAEFYFHALAETDISNDRPAYTEILGFSDGTHEEYEAGSFMIYANDKGSTPVQLAVDPPCFGWSEADKTNKYWMHNTIQIIDTHSVFNKIYTINRTTPISKFVIDNNHANYSFNITLDYTSINIYDALNKVHHYSNSINRNFNVIKAGNEVYYIINDSIDISTDTNVTNLALNINGNGNKNSGNTYFKEGNLYRWKYPCDNYVEGRKWSLTGHVAALNNNDSLKSYIEDPITQDGGINSTSASGIANDVLTRLVVTQPVNKTIFQTFLFPQKCVSDLPTVTKEETSTHVSTTIKFVNG